MIEIRRDIYLNRLIKRIGNGRAKVITGIRRCGKSHLLFSIFRNYLLSNGVDENHIIAISLDDDENEHLLDRHALGLEIRSRIKDDGTYYVFLDEIQNVDGFEMVINGLLHKPNVDIYVTGSNSKFLSSDIITEFRGRGDEVRVRPLSFSEIRSLYSSDEEAWDDYIRYGGLPPIYAEGMDDEQKFTFLEYVTRTIYIKDIAERNKIKDDKGLGNVLDLLSSSTGSLTNPLKIANTFRSKGQKGITDKTVSNYIRFFEEAYMIERVQRYDIKGKDYIESPYSLNSIRDFLGNIQSIRNAYQGSPSVDGTIQVPTNTLSTYIATLDADLDNRVKTAIQDAYDKISLMGEPFAYTCGAPEYNTINQDAIDACNVMNDIFNEVKNLLQANH